MGGLFVCGVVRGVDAIRLLYLGVQIVLAIEHLHGGRVIRKQGLVGGRRVVRFGCDNNDYVVAVGEAFVSVSPFFTVVSSVLPLLLVMSRWAVLGTVMLYHWLSPVQFGSPLMAMVLPSPTSWGVVGAGYGAGHAVAALQIIHIQVERNIRIAVIGLSDRASGWRHQRASGSA